MEKIENVTLVIEEKNVKTSESEFSYYEYSLILPTRFGSPVILKKVGLSKENKAALDMANQCNAFTKKDVK